MNTIVTSSEEETEQVAADLARRLPLGSMVALHGNLGCGKTVFARGFARALGILDYVTSPTFTIVQEYYFGKENRFYHLDLYRISNSDDAIAFGIDEFLLDREAYCLLEWPIRIKDLWTSETVHVYFEHVDEEHRSIRIEEKK